MNRRAEQLLFTACAIVWLAVGTRLGTSPTRQQFANGAFSDFFDIQAQQLLEGELALPPNAIGLEAFMVDGDEHMYFGLFPAIARMPIQALSDVWTARLTVLSVFVAWLVFTASAWALGRRMEATTAADAQMSATMAVLWRVLVALGTPVVMLAGPAWVFSEATIWGVATAMVFQWRLFRELEQSTERNQWLVVGAGILVALNRPTLALGCLLVLIAVVIWRARHGADRTTARLGLGAVATAAVLVIPNLARFGRLYGPPMKDQLLSQVDAQRQAMLAYNDGAFVDLRYVPTNLLAYLRPDGVSITTRFPFIDTPTRVPTVLFDAVYDITYRTPSIIAVAPALVLLAAIGVVSAIRSLDSGRSRHVLIVSAVGLPAAATLMTWGFIAPRYLADFVVVLVPLGMSGAVVLGGFTARVGRPADMASVIGVGVLVAWSVLANGAIAISSSYLTGPHGGVNELLRLQGRADYWGDERSQRLDSVGDFAFERTAPPAPGTIAILGECEAAYLSTGEPVDPWIALDYGPNGFRRTFSITLPPEPTTASIPLATLRAGDAIQPGDPLDFTLDMVIAAHGAVSLRLSDEYGFIDYPLAVSLDEPAAITITSDPVRGEMFFDVNGRTAHFGHYLTRSLYGPAGQTVTFSDGDTVGDLSIRPEPDPDSPC